MLLLTMIVTLTDSNLQALKNCPLYADPLPDCNPKKVDKVGQRTETKLAVSLESSMIALGGQS